MQDISSTIARQPRRLPWWRAPFATRTLQIGLASLLLLLFTIISGRPQLYPDTRAYYMLGQQVAITAKLFHPNAPSAQTLDPSTPIADADARERLAYTGAGGRSVYYSFYLFLLEKAGGIWSVVFVQSLAAAAMLFVLARVMTGGFGYLRAVAGLALFSSLPIYAYFVMPDIFAGIGIIGAVLLIACWPGLRRGERLFAAGALLVACLFHTTHLVITVALAVGGGVASFWPALRARGFAKGSAAVAGVIVLAVLAGALYPLAVRVLKHETIYSPPFITARIVADGPGRDYLRKACATGSPYALCAFKDKPLTSSDSFLWKRDPSVAVFQLADYDMRVAIIKEQPRFVLAVIASDPLGVLRIAATNAARLTVMYSTEEVLHDNTLYFRDPKFALFGDLLLGGDRCRSGAESCAPRIDPEVMDKLVLAGLIASIGLIGWLLASGRIDRRRWVPVLLLVLLGLLANAAVCGAISGPIMRYQSRLTWLIPTMALFMLASWRRDVAARRGDLPLAAAA